MKVRAEVVDFDFRGIITFFKTLSSDEIMTVNKKHKLIITLGFTSTKTLNNLNLANRLACCSRTGIVTQYLIDDALGGRHSVAWEHERAAEIQILNDGRGIVMPEKEKIRRVVREWQLCRAYNWFEREWSDAWAGGPLDPRLPESINVRKAILEAWRVANGILPRQLSGRY